MKEMDDGRFHKVANIIGQTMQYHPHGDAPSAMHWSTWARKICSSIPRVTGVMCAPATQQLHRDTSKHACPKFALSGVQQGYHRMAAELRWQKTGACFTAGKIPPRPRHGVEGIAVGLSTKILPHNFCELLEASIACLKGRRVPAFPDFATGGFIDVSNYDDGMRGGKVRVRAKLEVADKKTIIIREIPLRNYHNFYH